MWSQRLDGSRVRSYSVVLQYNVMHSNAKDRVIPANQLIDASSDDKNAVTQWKKIKSVINATRLLLKNDTIRAI